MSRWANEHDKCVKCGTIERKHQAHGFCNRCYFQEMSVEAKKKRKEYLKKYHSTPEVLKSERDRMRAYRQTKKGQIKEKRNNMVRRYRRFLKRKPFKHELNNIKIRVDGVEYITPFKPCTPHESKKLPKQLVIFKTVIKEQYVKTK